MEENVETLEEKEKITEQTIETKSIKDKGNRKKKKRRIGRTIANIITFILFLVIVLEAAIGVINMQRLNRGEEPVWYLNTKKTETELKTVVEYNLGLYKIVKTDTAQKTIISLKPFFIGE